MMFTERNVGLLLIIVKCLLVIHCETTCVGKHLLRAGAISCEEKQIILDEHNRLRQLVALGHVNGQPGAANMMEMMWDDELAAMAQRWADRCSESHDSQRNVRRFTVGQNIGYSRTTKSPGPYDDEPNWRRRINSWFNEVHSNQRIGHYTQLVWGDTFLLGCGYSFYNDPARGYTKNYVCNYGPTGNVAGYQPYRLGQPACGDYGMFYSNRYAGLCSHGNYSHLRCPHVG